jgi:hypothetical protein
LLAHPEIHYYMYVQQQKNTKHFNSQQQIAFNTKKTLNPRIKWTPHTSITTTKFDP